jgi:hypothetical protein
LQTKGDTDFKTIVDGVWFDIQACQELIQRREKVLERACHMDDEFSKREKAYKVQVACLLSNFQSDHSNLTCML